MIRPWAMLAWLLGIASGASNALCDERAHAKAAHPTLIDSALVRFAAPEIGGLRSPRFIFAREAAFEARLEALSDPEYSVEGESNYLARHVHAAVERHIAETLLAALKVEPPVSEREIEEQAEVAQRILLDRIGGLAALEHAARSEAMSEGDVSSVFRRRARAGIYLDRMVAPMLAPTSTELRQVYASDGHPYRNLAYDKALPLLRRWVIGQRLREAFDNYFQNARQRLTIVMLSPSREQR